MERPILVSCKKKKFNPQDPILVGAFGNIYSGAAWALTTGEPPSLNDVNVVDKWGGTNAHKVPSLYTYSAVDGSNWGYDIGDKAYVIRWSKLELEAPTRIDSLKRLNRTIVEAQLLAHASHHGPEYEIPLHLAKSPADVITDYLHEVAYAVRLDIESKRDARTLQEFPIDLVITHPAVSGII